MQILALAAPAFTTGAYGWLMILATHPKHADGGLVGWRPGAGGPAPSGRPPSATAASLAGPLLLLGAGGGAAAAYVGSGPRGVSAALLIALYAVGLLALIAAVVAGARIGRAMRGTSALRYPDPVSGALLGGGVGLAALALAGGLAAILTGARLVGGPAVNRGQTAKGGLVLAFVLAITSLAAGADALRRAAPILRRVRDNERLSRGSSPFRADR